MNLKFDVNSRVSNDEYVITLDAYGKPLSYKYSDKWDFSYIRSFSPKSVKSLNFVTTPMSYRSIIQDTLFQLYEKKKSVSIGTLQGYLTGLNRVSMCLGGANWAALNNDECYRTFKVKVKEKKWSFSSVERLSITINQLYDLGLTTRLIKNIKQFCNEHKCKDKKEKQAIALPEIFASKLFGKAVEIVEKYHPYRYEISKGYSEYYAAYDEWKNERGSNKGFSNSIGKRINKRFNIPDFRFDGQACDGTDIQMACILVMLGFSGVRLGEGLTFNPDSYHEKEYKSFIVPLISGGISKTESGGVLKPETWVTHPIVKYALELSYEMTQYAREYYKDKFKDNPSELTKSDSAFIKLDIAHVKNNVAAAALARDLKKFIKTHCIKMTNEDLKEFELLNPERKSDVIDNELPKLSAHDFRRTFAVFLVRNKLGDLMALKHQYKHLNVLMTQWYTNNSELARSLDISMDIELQELIYESNVSVTTDALFEIYNSETLSGKEGERIMSERNKNVYKGTIYITREEVERQVRTGTASVVEHPTGYCFNPTCDRICASDLSTITCQHEVTTPAKAAERQAVRERLIKRFDALNDGRFYMASILSELSLKIRAIEVTLTAHSIPFDPFNKLINAKSIVVREV
jgi:site-specific recombinase XerD